MAAEWFYTTNKQQMGPVTWDELRELAEVGILKANDMVWSEGMEEWVKAINQKGLFADDDGAESAAPKKKAAYSETKPPPGRRKRTEEEDDEDEEEDEREARRKARKREQESAKTKVGIKVGLIIGGIVLALLVGGACVVGIIVVLFSGWFGGGGGALVNDTFTLRDLRERTHVERTYRFTKGKRVVITSVNNTERPNTDVDVLVFQGSNLNRPGQQAMFFDVRTPDIDRNCRCEFVVPTTDTYTVRVVNLGPGMARVCEVKVEER